MKKLLLFLAVVVAATAVKEAIHFFGPLSQAYRAYREEAAAQVLARGKTGFLSDVEGNIVDVQYRLDAAEPAGEGAVRLVVTESIHFQRFSEMGPFGNRRVAQTEQRIQMKRVEGRWVVSEVEQGATEVKELAEIEF